MILILKQKTGTSLLKHFVRCSLETLLEIIRNHYLSNILCSHALIRLICLLSGLGAFFSLFLKIYSTCQGSLLPCTNLVKLFSLWFLSFLFHSYVWTDLHRASFSWQLLPSLRPVIVYFPDSYQWLSRAVAKSNRKEFLHKVEQTFESLSGSIVLICGQSKVENGPKEKEKLVSL